MTTAIIPTPTATQPFWSETVALDGTTYLLTFNYNQRCDCWYLSVGTNDGSDIVNGLKILSNWPLLKHCADNRLPMGEIVCFSTTLDVTPARLADLEVGGRCQLTYIPSTDLL